MENQHYSDGELIYGRELVQRFLRTMEEPCDLKSIVDSNALPPRYGCEVLSTLLAEELVAQDADGRYVLTKAEARA